MKIKGIENLAYKIPVELRLRDRAIVIEIEPMPFDFYSRIARELPEPTPPKVGFLKDQQGRWQRDENGRPLVEYNFQDEQYKKQVAENIELQNIALVYEAIKNCQEIEFETKREGKPAIEFYRLLAQEMQECGFKFKHFASILNAIRGDNSLAIENEKKIFS